VGDAVDHRGAFLQSDRREREYRAGDLCDRRAARPVRSEQMPGADVTEGGVEGKERFMAFRAFLTLCMSVSLLVGGAALARQNGTTSGPAAGKNVEPSTVTEKKYDNKAADQASSVGAGSPGVEAKPGTEGGKAGPGK
jgi:hypothetical protein